MCGKLHRIMSPRKLGSTLWHCGSANQTILFPLALDISSYHFLLAFVLRCKRLWSDAKSSLRGMFPSHNHILTSSLALTDILHLPCSRFTVQNVYRNLRPYGSSQISLKFITNAPQQFVLASHVLRIFWRRSIASGAYSSFVLRPRQQLKKLQTIHGYQPMMNQAKPFSPTLRSY